MTRNELKALLLKDPLSLDHGAIWRHDQSQREEIAQLRDRLRITAQLAIAEVGAYGPEDAESAVGRLVACIVNLREEIARLREILRKVGLNAKDM